MKKYILYNPQGGTEGHSQQYATQLCTGLKENGLSVHLVTSRDFDPQCVVGNGVDISWTDVSDSRKTMLRYDSWISKLKYGVFIVRNNFRSFGVLNKVLKAKPSSPCLLVGGDTLTNILYILWVSCWRTNVFALTIHNADYDNDLYRNDKVKLVYKVLSKQLLKLLLKTSAVVFVHGEAMQNALSSQLKVPKSRISIYKVPTPAGWNGESATPRVPKESVRLLFCGVVRHDKGFDVLCEALSKCKPYSDWQLRIAGSVRQVGESYVRNLVENAGIADRCSFNLKYLTADEIDSEFQSCDVVVLPYRRGFIAQSVVMTDAVRWCKPVVVSGHSQNGYDVDKYRLGWQFVSEDVESLASALSSAIRDFLNDTTQEFGFRDFMTDHSSYSVGRQIVAATTR